MHVLLLSSPAGPDADRANDTMAAQTGQTGTGAETGASDGDGTAQTGQTGTGAETGAADGDGTAQTGQTGTGAETGAADGGGTAQTGQTDPGAETGASDGNGAAQPGQAETGASDGNEAEQPGQTETGAADGNGAAQPGQAETGAANGNEPAPPKQSSQNQLKDTVTAPAGQGSFSVDLRVSESKAYAGIEFALIISNEDALSFTSFTPLLDGAAASPFMTADGKHYFGYYAGSNAFSAGDKLVGTLNFANYTGDQPLTVTVVDMTVIRLDEDNKAVTTEKASPVYVFTVKR